MNKENNIILISKDEAFAKNTVEKIKLLRKSDNVDFCGYSDALKRVMDSSVAVSIVKAAESDESMALIRQLKDFSPVILLADDADLILDAYDAGISDFCRENVQDFELVIRIVNILKKEITSLNYDRANRLLIQKQFLDKDTGFYEYKCAQNIINNELTLRALDSGTFVVLSVGENSKSLVSSDKIAKILKQYLRKDDIVTFGQESKFYLLLPYTDFAGAVSVIEKIKSACPEGLEIKAGLSSIEGKTFEQLEKEGLKALLDATYSDSTYMIGEYQPESLDDWLEDSEEQTKNYKLFRNLYEKKLEKVIIPVFYRIQKAYENKLTDSNIFQFVEKNQSVFHLKSRNKDSKLKILYSGLAKVTIEISHQGLDSPENKEINLSLSKINQRDLTKIVEDFVKEYIEVK